jgi:hypothetical protein
MVNTFTDRRPEQIRHCLLSLAMVIRILACVRLDAANFCFGMKPNGAGYSKAASARIAPVLKRLR